MPLTIAVISDIHIGGGSRSSDLVPPGATTDRPNQEFVRAFEQFASDRDLKADCLFVPGDLSTRADASEFLHASTVALRIAVALHVPPERVFTTFGNHDVDWSVLKLAEDASEDTREFRWQQRYSPIEFRSNLFHTRTTSPAFTGSITHPPYAGYWEDPDVFFVAVNTSAHDRPTSPIHYGLVRDETIAWLERNIPKRAVDDVRVRSLILHHHLVPHGNVSDEALDFSVCQNGDKLLSLLRALDFDLVVHGHKHRPRFSTELIESDFPIAILGAGSFCADLGGEFGGETHNQFHLLKVHGRDPESTRIFGQLQNWAYVHPAGWAENISRFTLIDHLIGFGGPLDWRVLAKRIRGPMHARAAAGRPFLLTSIGPIYEQLLYVSPETAKQAVEEVARAEKLDIAWLAGNSIDAYLE